MYNFIKGIISEIGSNYVVIENNGIGYMIFVSNPYVYEEESEAKIFTYTHIREDEYSLYGFKTKEEKDLFLKLINVKGLGPKMAQPMLATGSVSGIIDAIERENLLYLTKFPKIGDKLAKQIILDLKGKLSKTEGVIENTNYDELSNVLVSLGYKNIDIKKVLPQVNSSLTIENQVKEALRLLLK